MPVYKWVGNQILTWFENRMLGTDLSEFHTGFRAYKIRSLEQLPFVFNSDDFHFDTEIIVQAAANRWTIREVSIPTFYGEEECHVNGFRYAWNCVQTVVRFQLVQLGLFYQRNYDFGLFETENYHLKKSKNSLHQYLLRTADLRPEMVTIEIGCSRGIFSSHIAPRVARHIAGDHVAPDCAGSAQSISLNLNGNFSEQVPSNDFDCCFALDVIEHVNEPETFLLQVFKLLKVHGTLYISTPNICYLPLRIAHLLGQFNYGKRGILDKTHKRLFSVSSFQKLLAQYGFRVERIRGFAPPLTDLLRSNRITGIFESIHAWLSRIFPNLFSYNFLVVATRMDDISDIFQKTIGYKNQDFPVPGRQHANL